MKLLKISTVAALLVSANVYAVENVKVGGDAKLFYGTQDAGWFSGADSGLFEKDASYADFGVSLGVTADLMENVKAGVKAQLITTLGLENDIVVGGWSSAHSSESGTLKTTEWISEAWIEGKIGNTTGTIGRMTLDTPLVFTETWSMDYNTFEAITITNEDIPDTTLTGMFVGQSNGYGSGGTADANVMASGGAFSKLGSDGAFIVGATNNSVKPLTAQAWYYNLPNTLDAFWLQADVDYEGIIAGAQYTTINSDGGTDSDTAFAVKLGYAIPDIATITAAYSSVGDKGDRGGVYNIATDGQYSGTASALYTEFWWWFQTASVTGANTMTLSAEGSVADVDLFLGLYSAEIKPATSTTTDKVDEITFTASKSFGPIDTSIALMYDMFDTDAVKGPNYMEDLTSFQVYLTYNY
ncbi:hypothetical protein GJV85_00435 [Sulfurimonas aquatica]|uniref:Porin n=1 Tax=Sulfurimonas aquatica TaxID=2672570 RepID=A0A975AY00_9BACT|nr:hypothetical protein [Sulfurimonas aquatica]QSZ40646.1 hypothetical protein GJV85_00435 [Sulfurimonas aquatica]